MNILFIHQNFPGQYKHLAPALAERGHNVHAIGMNAFPGNPNITYHRYKNSRGTTHNAHPWVIDYEAKIIRAEACANLCQKLKLEGFEPDVICAHPGWGETLFLKEVWPEAKQLHFVEFFYGSTGRDVDFDPEFTQLDFAGKCRLTSKNTNNLLNLLAMDAGVSPTYWQHSTVPEEFQDKISVVHDGINTSQLCPDRSVTLTLKDLDGQSIALSNKDKIVTFVNRNLEPSRGYHSFMRALPQIQKDNPEAHILIIGGDGVSYGKAPDSGTWKQQFLNEVKDQLDLSKVHFLGKVPYDIYINTIRLSSCHIYLTSPFVLSWSMLESMSLGAPLLASSTQPVLEVIDDGKNGWLVDFFDYEQIANKTTEILNLPTSEIEKITHAARKMIIEKYDLELVCLPKHIELVENLYQQKTTVQHH